MSSWAGTFGIAARNFTAYPELPDVAALVDYAITMEQLGFDSIWVWDHILLGVKPHFPIIDSLTLLTAIAARTTRIRLGTGVLVLPLRNPVVLAKQLSSMDLLSRGRLILGLASGWYKREFDAVGVPFDRRGKIMDENLEIMTRFWTEEIVDGEYSHHMIAGGVMSPKPHQKPRPPILIGGYVDRVLRRAAERADGWLTYFYRPESFAKSWGKIRDFASAAGKDPDSLLNAAQLPIRVGSSRAEVEREMMEWLQTEWDYASWSESTKDSAILGTVDDCVEQLQAHLDVGVQKIVFVPYRYEREQIETIAREIIPRLKRTGG
jgi:probable F420-dependent oxidoreductase